VLNRSGALEFAGLGEYLDRVCVGDRTRLILAWEKSMEIRYPFAVVIFLLTFSSLAKADSIWIEGENANVKQITAHPWYDSVKNEVLSGGAWAGHFNRDKQGLLAYEFQAAADDTYRLWLRANHVKSSLSYRLNNGPW